MPSVRTLEIHFFTYPPVCPNTRGYCEVSVCQDGRYDSEHVVLVRFTQTLTQLAHILVILFTFLSDRSISWADVHAYITYIIYTYVDGLCICTSLPAQFGQIKIGIALLNYVFGVNRIHFFFFSA